MDQGHGLVRNVFVSQEQGPEFNPQRERIMCVGVLPPCVSKTLRGHRVLDTLELELQAVMSCHVGVENPARSTARVLLSPEPSLQPQIPVSKAKHLLVIPELQDRDRKEPWGSLASQF